MFMKWTKYIFNSTKQLLQIVVLSLFLIEFIGFFVFDPRYFWEYRYLYYSNDPIINEFNSSKKFWKYKPNSEIRFAAAYQSLLGIKIEYDCTFKSNKFGFIDTGEVWKKANYLVLGDSFTEGHGGCPWLTAKTLSQDEILSKYKVLNGGLQGTGILQFEQVLEYFETQLDIENLVIIAIANDFKRPDAFVWHTNSECYKIGNCGIDDWWHYVPLDTSEDALLNIADARSSGAKIDFFDRVLRWSFAYHIFQEYKTIIRNRYEETSVNKYDDLTPYQKNLEALERIKKKYPNLRLILVPQRDEVGFLGKKNRDSQLIEKYLKSKNYIFEWCDLTANDYMPLDGHPNGEGYKKLFTCLRSAITP